MGHAMVIQTQRNQLPMKTETERKCPNCKKNNLDRGMWFWICIHCHFAESIETGRVDNPGKPLRVKSLPNSICS